MVERKLRPAPSTLHLLPSRKPAKSGCDVRVEALRPRHQRPAARPDEPVPVRGARHLPADLHARGARQQQEGHDRGRAQRAPGEPLPRRARHRARRDGRSIAKGIPLDAKSNGAATGRLYLQTETISTALPPSLAGGKADNQILARRRCTSRSTIRSARSIAGVEGHQHAHQGARARHGGRGLLQRQGPRGHRAPLLGHARAARGFLGQARQGHGVVAAGRPHVLPRDGPAGAVAAAERVPLPREEGRGAVLRDRQGDRTARRRCCRRSRTTRTRRTTSGASPRATASRTSRSTC